MLPGARLAQLDDALEVWRVPLDSLREQEVNAQVLTPSAFDRLTNTIASEKHLESLPYCVARDGHFEIISGHHRTRAARAAGLDEVVILADTRPLTRDQVVAKQIAHNTIAGESDPDTLRRMYLAIDDVNARIEAFVDEAKLNIAIDRRKIQLNDVQIPFEWHYVLLAFLPNQQQKWEDIIRRMDRETETVGCLSIEVFDRFAETCRRVGVVQDIRNIGATIMRMVEIAEEWLEQNETPIGEAALG